MAHHPDKIGPNDRFVLISNAYNVLRDDAARREFDDELVFFRKHGRLRWQLRYRLKPSPWLVAIIAIAITSWLQYVIKRSHHFRMQEAAKMTKEYLDELRRRRRLGLDETIIIDVKGAEMPAYTDVWPIQLLLLPYKIGRSLIFKAPKEVAEAGEGETSGEEQVVTAAEPPRVGKRKKNRKSDANEQ